MTDTPTISVVIPLYNKREFIERALRSITKQTRLPLEVIVVNDGSVDGGEALALPFQPLVRVVNQVNQGVSAARNRGIQEAAGEFIAFLDADDEWLPDYLQVIEGLIDRYPTCAVYGTSYDFVDEDGTRRKISRFGIDEVNPIQLLSDLPKAYLGDPPLYTSSVTARKAALTKIGGFPLGVKLGEDIETWFRLSLEGCVAYAAASHVLYHRDTGKNTCAVVQQEDELHAVKTARALLNDDANHNRASIQAFIDGLNFNYAQNLLIAGEIDKARSLLRTIKPFHSPRHFFKWTGMFMLTLTPRYMTTFVRRLRRSTRND